MAESSVKVLRVVGIFMLSLCRRDLDDFCWNRPPGIVWFDSLRDCLDSIHILPDRMIVGQPQREIREMAYADNRARPHYEYVELTTSDSESSQYLDPDSSDDDGHRDCGLGGYEYCPDNPANYRTTQYQEGDSNKNHPDSSDRGIT